MRHHELNLAGLICDVLRGGGSRSVWDARFQKLLVLFSTFGSSSLKQPRGRCWCGNHIFCLSISLMCCDNLGVFLAFTLTHNIFWHRSGQDYVNSRIYCLSSPLMYCHCLGVFIGFTLTHNIFWQSVPSKHKSLSGTQRSARDGASVLSCEIRETPNELETCICDFAVCPKVYIFSTHEDVHCLAQRRKVRQRPKNALRNT